MVADPTPQGTYVEARSELEDVRRRLREIAVKVMAAAEQAHPGIGAEYETLTSREVILYAKAIRAATQADYL